MNLSQTKVERGCQGTNKAQKPVERGSCRALNHGTEPLSKLRRFRFFISPTSVGLEVSRRAFHPGTLVQSSAHRVLWPISPTLLVRGLLRSLFTLELWPLEW